MSYLFEMLLSLVVGAIVLCFLVFRSKHSSTAKQVSQGGSADSVIAEGQKSKKQKEPPEGSPKNKKAQLNESFSTDGAKKDVGKDAADKKDVGKDAADTKAAAKREALRQQAKKQAAQRKAREMQREVALQKEKKQKDAAASDAASACVCEVLGAVDNHIESKVKKQQEVVSMATSIVQDMLRTVDTAIDANFSVGEAVPEAEPPSMLDAKSKVEQKREQRLQLAKEMASLRPYESADLEEMFLETGVERKASFNGTSPSNGKSSHADMANPSVALVHNGKSNHADMVNPPSALPPCKVKGVETDPAKVQAKQSTSQLSPLEREIFKHEKKLREICKLQDRRDAGEDLDPKQIEKLSRAGDIAFNLKVLRETQEEEQRIIAEEQHRLEMEQEQSALKILDEEVSDDDQPAAQNFSLPTGFRVMTRQSTTRGVDASCSNPLAQTSAQNAPSSPRRGPRAALLEKLAAQDSREDDLQTRSAAPQILVRHQQRPAEWLGGEARDESPEANSPPRLVAPQILKRPQSWTQAAETAQFQEPKMTLQERQRQYAEVRARIFKPTRGRGSRRFDGRGRGYKSTDGAANTNSSTGDFKSDPDYDRSRFKEMISNADYGSDSSSSVSDDSM